MKIGNYSIELTHPAENPVNVYDVIRTDTRTGKARRCGSAWAGKGKTWIWQYHLDETAPIRFRNVKEMFRYCIECLM